ncbi:MAG: SGNH/GDSL hydrolase family protein [Atopobiaceae bacterium]|nr:SGNH/GDSL hydrolase family protein [Atopobiaceae bacterium]
MSRHDGGRMSLFEVLTSASSHAEAARALLYCAKASPFVRGAVTVENESAGWVRPHRVDYAQARALESCLAWHPGLYRSMARTTAGVCVRFATDGAEVALAVRMDDEPRGTAEVLGPLDRGRRRAHDGLSVVVDGRVLGCGMPRTLTRPLPWIENTHDMGILSFELEKGDERGTGTMAIPGLGARHEVCIWLPCLRGCAVRELWSDGTYVEPLEARGSLLVLGDGVGQGFCADDPLLAWPTLLAEGLDFDVINQSIAGQVFQPSMLMGASIQGVELVVIALGTRYRRETCAMTQVKQDVRAFLREVVRRYENARVVVVTPYGRNDTFSSVIRRAARDANVEVVDGHGLFSSEDLVFADEVHPTSSGHAQIAARLNWYVAHGGAGEKTATMVQRAE